MIKIIQLAVCSDDGCESLYGLDNEGNLYTTKWNGKETIWSFVCGSPESKK